jgi:membrane associated rhomboid family serine protease
VSALLSRRNFKVNNGTLTFILIAAFILFAIFRRARGLVTFQKVSQQWMALRLAAFGVLGLLVLALSLTDSLALAGDLVGLVAGAVVAYFGLRLTTFERRPD